MNAKRTTGFTIAELVLAMAIASVVGLSVAVVSTALSTAHEHSMENDVHVQTARSVIRRIESEIRKSKLVVKQGATELALWSSDADESGSINISELKVIGYDASADRVELTRVVFPDDMDATTREALDIEISLSEINDASSVTDEILNQLPSYVQQTTLADNVLDVSVSTDEPPPKTRVVKFKVQIGTPESNVTLYGGAALRADRTDWLVRNGDDYTIVPPE